MVQANIFANPNSYWAAFYVIIITIIIVLMIRDKETLKYQPLYSYRLLFYQVGLPLCFTEHDSHLPRFHCNKELMCSADSRLVNLLLLELD